MASRRRVAETPTLWRRILWLDQEIRNGTYPNVQRMQEEFECGRRTAFNTVCFLRDSLDAPIAYDRAHGGYHYTDPTYALPTVFMREGELFAVLLAEQVSRHYLGTPLEEPLRRAIEKLNQYLDERVRVALSEVANRFRFFGGTGLDFSAELLADLRTAIRERRVVRIVYYSPRTDAVTEREIEPHYVDNVRGDWMVVAWDRLRDRKRRFMLGRIREWSLMADRFQFRPEIDRQRQSGGAYLADYGDEREEIVLKFDEYQARWIRERQWHPSQSLELRPDGSLIMRLVASAEGDLLRWVLGYGHHVEVLAPAWLRERVIDEARRMLSGYGVGG